MLDLFNYWVYVALMMIGLYAVIAKPNLVKKLLGLSLFQTGIFIFYISLGLVDDATAPIVWSPTDRVRQVLPRLESADEAALARVERALHEGDEELEHTLHELPDVAPEERSAKMEATRAAVAERLRAALGDLSEEDEAAFERSLARPYANPLPHVLILTAIVVSVSTLAVALAIVVEIKRAYGTVEAPDLVELER